MADNKQYITQEQEHGLVMISEDVIATIALHALNDIDGFAGLAAKPGADIVEILGKIWGKGLRIQIAADNALTISCNVVVKYGYSVMDVAAAVQSGVCSAVESMTGVEVKAVNVNVCGIERQ